MKVLSYDALAQNFRKAWAAIEAKGDEVVVTRNRKRIARIVPETQTAGALEVFGNLEGLLGERAGAILGKKLAEVQNGKRRKGTLRELRNPWVS